MFSVKATTPGMGVHEEPYACYGVGCEENGENEKQTCPFFFLTSTLTRPFLSEPRIGKMRKQRLLRNLGLKFFIVIPPPDITYALKLVPERGAPITSRMPAEVLSFLIAIR